MSHGRGFVLFAALAAGIRPMPGAENVIGRTIPGAWVMPQGGVVGAAPGFSFTIMPVGYMGSMSSTKEAPLFGQLVTGLSLNINSNFLAPQFNYKLSSKKFGLSTSALIPVNWQSVTASLVLDQPREQASRSTNQSSVGIADVVFSPLTFGIHFSEESNLAIDTKIFVPSGSYKPGYLANLGMNEWTFMPNATYTYMKLKKGLEVTNNVGFDIYTQNPVSKYTSGTVFHWDGLLMQYLSKKGGIGAIVSNVTQITRDTGPFADRLNGFKGRAWAAGPIVLWTLKEKNPTVVFQLRWLNEFAVSQRTNGNTLLLGLTLQM